MAELAPAPAPATPSSETCNGSGAAAADTPTLWVIGDSTASVYAANLYPRMGWAQPLQDSFAPACATIQDRAISGRSSKSFFDEGAWTPVRDALKRGDFVLIQFGHNDEKSGDPLRFTDPFTTFQQYLSTYLDDTLARGATPILLTPIQRNKWTGPVLADTHGQYPAAIRDLAQARGVALVDATALTKSYFESIGESATTLLFMDLAVGQFPNYPDGNVDNTHLQEGGARAIARLILADLARQGSPIARLLRQAPMAP
jgi:lysophospholipase L1-like esterase